MYSMALQAALSLIVITVSCFGNSIKPWPYHLFPFSLVVSPLSDFSNPSCCSSVFLGFLVNVFSLCEWKFQSCPTVLPQIFYLDVSIVQPPIIHPSVLGKLVFELFKDTAPLAAKHFCLLAVGVDRFGYQNTIFHCIISDFIIQGRDIDHEDGFGGRSLCGNTFHSKGIFFFCKKYATWVFFILKQNVMKMSSNHGECHWE